MTTQIPIQTKPENYKGVFYNNDQEIKSYEHGAHFPYFFLYSRLESLIKTLSPERRGDLISINTLSNCNLLFIKVNPQTPLLILKPEKLLLEIP